MQQTREQKFATAVFGRVSEIAQLGADDQTKYGSMAHQLPVLIRTAGLAQALAFVDAKAGTQPHDPLRRLLTHLQHVLREAQVLGPEQDLLAQSRAADLRQYMRLTQDALQALLWFKRFAQSVLDVTADQEVKP